MYINLTENQLHNLVSGKNKAFMTRTINKQKKYGNIEIFYVCINTHDRIITIGLGESQGCFVKRRGEWEHDYGNLYKPDECTAIVNELATKIGL